VSNGLKIEPEYLSEFATDWMASLDPMNWLAPDAWFEIHDRPAAWVPPRSIDPVTPLEETRERPAPTPLRVGPSVPLAPPEGAGDESTAFDLGPVSDLRGGDLEPPVSLPAYPYFPPAHAAFESEGDLHAVPRPAPWPLPSDADEVPAPALVSPYDLLPVSKSLSIKGCGCGSTKPGCGCGG